MTLSDTLRDALDGHVDLDLDLSAVHRRADRRRRRRARARAAGGAFGAAVILVGLVALAAGAGDQRPDVMAQEGEIPTDEPTTSEPPSTSDPAPSTESTTTTETPTTSTPTSTSTEPVESTTTEPAPTTEPPPTTEAEAPLVLSWTYAGTEHWRLSQPQCAQLTHWLDAEAIGSDASTWTMREDYCGENHGDRWEGEGTFSLTGDAGSITGRMTSAAPMPTTGVPYTWTVEGGTGAYDGARGDCVVTITMTDAVFGSAHHEGTITCDLDLGMATAGGSVPGSP